MAITYDEGDAPQNAPSDALRRITELAALLAAQEDRVRMLDEQLTLAKASARRTATEDLPLLMEELGLSELTLADGTKVSVGHDLSCGISAARMPEAVSWLEARGYSGIVKTKLSVEFGRAQHDEALALKAQVEGLTSCEVNVDNTIHPQTLKAFLKERLEVGEAVPFDLFGVVPFDKVKLQAPRSARKR